MNYTGSLTPDIARAIEIPFFTCVWLLRHDREILQLLARSRI